MSHVSAVRGFIYDDQISDNDMGLIVAYIKTDGQAYYRQFVDIGTGAVAWVIEASLPFVSATPPFLVHLSM